MLRIFTRGAKWYCEGSFATELANAGVSSRHLQKLMGHTSGRMLDAIYDRGKQGQHLHDAMAHATAPGGAKNWTDSVRDRAASADATDTPEGDCFT